MKTDSPQTNPLAAFQARVRALADPAKAAHSLRFFKTGPGEYGEGDRFLGLTVPQTRSLLPGSDILSEADVLILLHSAWHEERLLALLIFVRRFERAKKEPAVRRRIVDLYLTNTPWINNWDLVDASAPNILGAWWVDHDRAGLKTLRESGSLWEQRIAVLATFAFIRRGEFADTLQLCASFLTHRHDLMHKACGWMLREVGKRDLPTLLAFLDQHAPEMPRTMLRYAIEKLEEPARQRYLAVRTRP